MNILESKLAARFLFPNKQWLERVFKAGASNEQQVINKMATEDLREIIDASKLTKHKLDSETKVTKIEKGLAV